MGKRSNISGMKRKGRPGPHSGGQRKKIKRSKKFWQQRKTAEIAPIPEQPVEESSESEESEPDEPSGYDVLVNAFAEKTDRKILDAIESESEEDSIGSGIPEEVELIEKDRENESEEAEESEFDQEENEAREEEVADESDENEIKEEVEEALGDLTGVPNDPFVSHFSLELCQDLKENLYTRAYNTEILKFKHLGSFQCQNIQWTSSFVPFQKKRSGSKLDPEQVDREIREHQDNHMTNKTLNSLAKLGWRQMFQKPTVVKNIQENEDLKHSETELLHLLASYKDLLFQERTSANAEQLRRVFTIHALNHLLKTRAKVILNNATIQQGNPHNLDLDSFRDQGFCRPKVLIVVPFRESAKRIVNCMIKLLFSDPKGKVTNKSRFDQEFDSPSQNSGGTKPDDYYETFSGNIDDGFKLGMTVTKKSLKIYSDFYCSDIILASPLGLRLVIGSDEDDNGDRDFLSSIEMLILDQADVFTMQNWEHIITIFDNINKPPKRSHEVDYTRIRLWSLNKLSPFYRQTLIFSNTPMPELSSVFRKYCQNYAGKLQLCNPVLTGSISQVVIKTPMTFHRVKSSSVTESLEDRFRFFTNTLMPKYTKDVMFHTFVFVPSYFDFVKVRNWFNSSDLDFLEICEYTKDKDIAKARDHFYHSDIHFLLYTERVHFYRRFFIKGIRHLIFYQPPQNPHFFSEISNFMQLANQNKKGGSDTNMTCTILYTKYDMIRLSQIVGSSRAKELIISDKPQHVFVADHR